MGLLEDIVAEIAGRKASSAKDDPPHVRLANALLMRMEPEKATHLRVVSGPEPRMDFRVEGSWRRGPDVSGSRPSAAARVCDQVIGELAAMTETNTRAPCSFGAMYLILGNPPGRPEHAQEFSSFHVQKDGGRAIVIHAVRGAAMPWTEQELARRQESHAAMRTAFEQRTRGHAAEAVVTLEQVLHRCENEPTISPVFTAEILEGLARAKEDLGDLDAAIALWLRAIAMTDAACTSVNVASACSWTELARLELDRNELPAAGAHLARAQGTFHALLDDASVYLHLELQAARAHRMQGDHAAHLALEKARARAARVKDVVVEGCAAYELGLLAGEHGDLPRAAAHMRDALAKLDAPQPFTAEIELALSRVLRAQGRDPEALSLVQHANEIMALHRAPDHPERVKAEIELARFEKPGRPYR